MWIRSVIRSIEFASREHEQAWQHGSLDKLEEPIFRAGFRSLERQELGVSAMKPMWLACAVILFSAGRALAQDAQQLLKNIQEDSRAEAVLGLLPRIVDAR
jgi:hypothetical protein